MKVEKYSIIGRDFFRYQYSILQLCEIVNQYVNGNLDCYEPVTPFVAYSFLCHRIDNWKIRNISADFDNAAKSLLEVAVKRYENCERVPKENDVKKYLKKYPNATVFLRNRIDPVIYQCRPKQQGE